MSVARVLARREDPKGPPRRVVRRIGVAAVLRVLPPESRPARSQGSWVRTVEAHPDVALLRADARRNLRMLVWELARWADWDTETSRPTWQRLRSAAGLSRSTVAKWLAWLRERELLAIVEHGSTPHFRAGVLDNGTEGNLASVYLLCEPCGDEPARNAEEHPHQIFPVHETRTPSWKPSIPTRQITRARASIAPPQSGGAAKSGPDIPPGEIGDTPMQSHDHKNATREGEAKVANRWPMWRPAGTRTERLALCERLREESPPLRAAGSARRLRHLLRPWLLAGWSSRGLLYAIDHTPDGALWPYAWRSVRELRNPAGWLRHRLRAWRDSNQLPLPDPYRTTGDEPDRAYSAATLRPSAQVAAPERVRSVTAAIRAQLRASRRWHNS
ncbi:MAG: hypothetical protein ACM37V_06015 [Gemmatimonadota bacterium]